MAWVFSGLTLGAVILATFASHLRNAILSLWFAGLGIGALYLTWGAEFLAILQWIVSTLVAILFMFFSVMFGEYRVAPVKKNQGDQVFLLLALGIGALFAGIIILGTSALPEKSFLLQTENDLADLGMLLVEENLLALEVLGLTLFLVLVGAGVISRLGRDES